MIFPREKVEAARMLALTPKGLLRHQSMLGRLHFSSSLPISKYLTMIDTLLAAPSDDHLAKTASAQVPPSMFPNCVNLQQFQPGVSVTVLLKTVGLANIEEVGLVALRLS